MRVHFGEFVLDRETRQLSCATRELPLEPKAFELLDFLLRRRPRALSKAQLRDHLWASTVVSDSRLGSLVAEVRAALGDEARRPRWIRTVHGFGYAFSGSAVDLGEGDDDRSVSSAGRLRLFWGEREIPLAEGENVLGRVEAAATWIEAPTVSRRHARIRVSRSEAILEDLGSKNGTWLRGKRLSGPVRLEDGDELWLGRVRMTFRILPLSAPTETGVAS
jgi:DNA-binding winged helix-turn-helix (wHTH) protein